MKQRTGSLRYDAYKVPGSVVLAGSDVEAMGDIVFGVVVALDDVVNVPGVDYGLFCAGRLGAPGMRRLVCLDRAE